MKLNGDGIYGDVFTAVVVLDNERQSNEHIAYFYFNIKKV